MCDEKKLMKVEEGWVHEGLTKAGPIERIRRIGMKNDLKKCRFNEVAIQEKKKHFKRISG